MKKVSRFGEQLGRHKRVDGKDDKRRPLTKIMCPTTESVCDSQIIDNFTMFSYLYSIINVLYLLFIYDNG